MDRRILENDNYPLIENHGVIGNMKTLGMITTDGVIDFYCFPYFDSPAVFCSLLDSKKGGYWRISPDCQKEELLHTKQFYLPESNVLVTRFFTKNGVAEIIDYMPLHTSNEKRKRVNGIIRKVVVKSGEMDLVMRCVPTFNFARDNSQALHILDTEACTCLNLKQKQHIQGESPEDSKTIDLNTQKHLDVNGNGEELERQAVMCSSYGLCLSLSSDLELELDHGTKDDPRKGVIKKFHLTEGNSAVFILKEAKNLPEELQPKVTDSVKQTEEYKQLMKWKQADQEVREHSKSHCETGLASIRVAVETEPSCFHETQRFWSEWLKKCSYTGRWREMIHRSALVLKLLTFEETGAIVAAGTTSIPSVLGGERNWDYRYTWIRDASFTLYAFLRIGFTAEAEQFMTLLQKICEESASKYNNEIGPLQIMYKIDGSSYLPEEILTNLEGYKASTPVRVGNGAYDQLQLDIYGELMDSVYLYNKYASPVSFDFWVHLRRMLNWLADNWKRKDESIWEMRSGRQHYVYSRIMCWVAFDRGLRLADRRSFPAPRERWMKVRDEIYEEIIQCGWSEKRQAFVQYYGSDSLDASTLIMPLVFFMAPNDPKMLKTLKAVAPDATGIKSGGLTKNGMILRYDYAETIDNLLGVEGNFNICSFWYIEALTRAGKFNRSLLEDARWKFEDMLSYANHLGLFAEQTSTNGSQLGNFPQAFSHLALISAAYNLDRSLNGKY